MEYMSAIAATSMTSNLFGFSHFDNESFDKNIDELLLEFIGEDATRPEYVWFNREDILYHDYLLPDEVESHPDFWLVGRRRVKIFNKAMEWYRNAKHGTIISYCPTKGLMLSGENQVSAWHSSPPNELKQDGEFTSFTKKSRWQRDCAVLPAFQFHLGQHPVLELEVTEAEVDWQFCITIKGRGGAPFIASAWQNGPGKLTFDIKKELQSRGYDLQFAELHFAIGVWTENPKESAQIKYRISMPSHSAIIANLPMVRTAERAKSEGVPIEAVVINKKGQLLSDNHIKLVAKVLGKTFPMTEKDGVWTSILQDLPEGNHSIQIESNKSAFSKIQTPVRVTNGEFFQYDKTSKWITKNEKILGPLTGSFQGTFFFKNVGLPNEQIVQSQQEWDTWDRTQKPGEHMHFWEALTPLELDARFSYLSNQGFDLLHLHSHWGTWERLDAGGRISPHAAEQLALYMRTADKYGLAHIQALSSGPYGVPEDRSGYGDTVVFSRYLDEGFKPEEWFEPTKGRFNDLFHQYLDDFTTLFKDETALFGMTASGEGDNVAPKRAEDTYWQIRKNDQNHIMLSEPIDVIDKLPENHCIGFPQDMCGGRTYRISENETFPEFDLGVEFKLYKTVDNVYMAEGSWATMPSYDLFHGIVVKDFKGNLNPWTGTNRYRIRLRDTLYLGLVHRLAIMNTWDETITEDEHKLVKEIRNKIDWTQKFMDPAIAIFVNDDCAGAHDEGRVNVAKYERAFAGIPLDYRLYTTSTPPSSARVVIDGREPFMKPKFKSEGGIILDEIKNQMPLEVSENYSANYSQSEDGRTLLAYFYNTMDHVTEKRWLAGNHFRVPKPTKFSIKIKNLPKANLRYTLYDLNEKKVFREYIGYKCPDWYLENTDHDFFLLVTPV